MVKGAGEPVAVANGYCCEATESRRRVMPLYTPFKYFILSSWCPPAPASRPGKLPIEVLYGDQTEASGVLDKIDSGEGEA